jgi:hypothetical protein
MIVMYVLVLLKKRYNPIEISDLLDELNAYLEMIGGKTKVLMSTIKKTTAQIAGKTITIEPEAWILFIDLTYDDLESVNETFQRLGIEYTVMTEWTGSEMEAVEVFNWPHEIKEYRRRWYCFWFEKNLSSYEEYEELYPRINKELESVRHGIYSPCFGSFSFMHILEDCTIQSADYFDANRPLKYYTFSKGQQFIEAPFLDEDFEEVKDIMTKMGLKIKCVTTWDAEENLPEFLADEIYPNTSLLLTN